MLWLRFVLVLGIVGCGTVPATDDAGTGGQFSISVAPPELGIPVGGSGMITVTVTRTGATGDITLDATLPPGVSATFTPSTLAAGTTSSELLLAVNSSAQLGTSTVTITGTTDSVTKSADVMLTVAAHAITVSGTVRGGRENVLVRIPGKTAVMSDAAGHFTFSDVVPPYDIYTVVTDVATRKLAYYYEGVSRVDPVLDAAPDLVQPTEHTGTVSGTKSGHNSTDPMIIAWSDDGGVSFSAPTTSTYALTARWTGTASTKQGTLYGIQYKRQSGSEAPASWGVYGSALGSVTEGQTSSINLALNPLNSTAALTGSIVAPAGFPTPMIVQYQQFGNGAVNVAQWTGTGTTTSAATVIPLIPAGKACIIATSAISTGTAFDPRTSVAFPGLAAATDVSYALPAPASLMAPNDGATDVTSMTQFNWQSPPTSVSVVKFSDGVLFTVEISLFTTNTTGTIPMVPEVSMPASSNALWYVLNSGPFASIDDAVGPSAVTFVGYPEFTGSTHFGTSSAARTFKTQ